MVLEDVKTVLAALSDIGLRLNPGKCELLVVGVREQEAAVDGIIALLLF
jgi:hypothetical protein